MSRAHDEFDDFDDVPRGSAAPHRGVMVLVLGILSLMICGVLGIFAWSFGKRDPDLMSRGLMDKEGEALTRVGYILGIVGSILFMVQLLFVVAYIAFFAIMIASK